MTGGALFFWRKKADTFCSLVPEALADGVDLRTYRKLVTCHDGFLLLRGGAGLCVYKPVTGESMFLPLPDAELTCYVEGRRAVRAPVIVGVRVAGPVLGARRR